MKHASAMVNMEDFMDRARARQRFQSEVLHVHVMETLTCLLERLVDLSERHPEVRSVLQGEVESLGWQDARHLFMVPTSELLLDMQRLFEVLDDVQARQGVPPSLGGGPQ